MALTISETIRLLLPDGTVKRLPLEDYLRGVVAAALPADTPLEAMKALAVAARTFAANTHRHLDRGADVCTLRHCQAWNERANPRAARAVMETRSIAALYKDALIEAFYFEHCDGKTRDSVGVLVNAPAYLKSVTCPCGSASLKGHGIGMCKRGMIVMARLGEPYQYILKHYYTGIALEELTIDPHARAPEARPHAFHSGADVPPPAAPTIPAKPEPRPAPAPRRRVVPAPTPAPTAAPKPDAQQAAAPPPTAPKPAKTTGVPSAVPRGSPRPKPEQAPAASASEPVAPPIRPAEQTPAAPAKPPTEPVVAASAPPPVETPAPIVAASAPPPVETPAPIVAASALTDQPQAEEADELLYYLAVEDIPPPTLKPAVPPESAAPPLPSAPPSVSTGRSASAAPPFELPPASMPEEMPTALNLEFIAPPSFMPETMPSSYDDMLGAPPSAPPAPSIEPNLDDFMPPVEKFYTPLDAPPSIPEGLPAFDSTVRAEDTPFAWVAPPPLFEDQGKSSEPRILLDALPGPRIIAGNLPKAGVIVTIRDARGNSIVTVSGVARQYGAGGFEAPLTDDGAYHVKFDGTELDVKLESETVFIYAS